jgi:hypothetical protein
MGSGCLGSSVWGLAGSAWLCFKIEAGPVQTGRPRTEGTWDSQPVTAAARPQERGSAAVETVIVVPLLLLFMLLMVCGGRVALAHGEADSAARDGARAASIARSAGAAGNDARAAAAAALATAGISCRSFSVAADTSRFRPGGVVTVQVACTAALHDLGLLGVPGSRTLHGRYTAPVDRFRGVQ